MTAGLLQLQCPYCEWFPDGDITQGVVKAHFDVEHPDGEFRLALVARCPRCLIAMTFDGEIRRGPKVDDHFTCPRCHRSAKVTRTPPEDRR